MKKKAERTAVIGNFRTRNNGEVEALIDRYKPKKISITNEKNVEDSTYLLLYLFIDNGCIHEVVFTHKDSYSKARLNIITFSVVWSFLSLNLAGEQVLGVLSESFRKIGWSNKTKLFDCLNYNQATVESLLMKSFIWRYFIDYPIHKEDEGKAKLFLMRFLLGKSYVDLGKEYAIKRQYVSQMIGEIEENISKYIENQIRSKKIFNDIVIQDLNNLIDNFFRKKK